MFNDVLNVNIRELKIETLHLFRLFVSVHIVKELTANCVIKIIKIQFK